MKLPSHVEESLIDEFKKDLSGYYKTLQRAIMEELENSENKTPEEIINTINKIFDSEIDQ